MRKTTLIQIFLFLFLVALPISTKATTQTDGLGIIAPQFAYLPLNQTVYFKVQVFNGTKFLNSTEASCDLTIRDNNGNSVIYTTMLTSGDIFYYIINSTQLSEGTYQYIVSCSSNQTEGYASALFDVTEGANPPDNPNTGLILFSSLIPILFGIALVFGVSLLREQHSVLKIFSILLLPFLFISSVHILIINLIHFFHFTELENVLASNVYLYGVIAFILFSYTGIYVFYVGFKNLQTQKQERFNF